MRKATILCCFLLFVPTLAMRARAQDAPKPPEAAKAPEPPAHYYHFEYAVQEVGSDGKPTNSRTYSMVVSTERNERFSVRTGSRVPIITSALHGAKGDGEPEIQYQYLDVGVNIDARDIHEIGSQLAFHLDAEVSGLADDGASAGSAASNSGLANGPVIRQNSWRASVVIPVGKPTVVFTSDALENKSGMQLVMTATPVK